MRRQRDARENDTEIQYNDDYAFAYPTKVITPVPDTNGTNGSNTAFETTTVYDFDTGLPTSVTDANNQTTQMEYNDLLLRPTKVIAPNGHQTISEYGEPDSNGQFPASQRFVKVKTQIDESNWSEGYTWFDGLGRTVKLQSIDSEGDIFVETQYDNMGRGKKVTNPYRTGETVYWTENFYDELGRVTKIKTPDNAEMETVYSLATSGNQIGTVVTVEDQAGKLRRSIANALGQLIRVDEPNDTNQLGTIDSPSQPTLYSYNILNKLTQVTQGVQTRTFQYDSLSRLKEATNPESGTTSYTYNANGNLQTKRDARGIKTIFDYDALNRVLKRCYRVIGTGSLGATSCANAGSETAEPNTLDVSYFYDNLTNAKGKLVKVVTGDTQNSFSKTEYTEFDVMGRVKKSKQTTDGTAYELLYSYNLSGALIEQTYPSGRVVKNILDNDGRLSMVKSKKNSNYSFWNYAHHFTYTAAGAVSSMQLGNGRWESTQSNNRLQLTQIALGNVPNATNLLKINYDYGTTANNGNVLSQTVEVPDVGQSQGFTAVQTYTYDSLNRLKSATENIDENPTPSWKQTFSFDRYGNRNFDEANTTTIPKNCNNNTEVCSADRKVFNPSINTSNNRLSTSSDYVFDNAGNTTSNAQGRTFVYDAENKQVEVKDSQNQTVGQYFYDGDGNRVKKVVPATGETTIFVYDASGRMVAEYSTIVASQQDAKVSYLTQDQLGSPRITTDANGNVISRRDFHPFGEEIIGIGGRTQGLGYLDDTVRQKFTSYERDTESDLDFAQARYYNSLHGRFTSVDPIMMEKRRLADPQAINLYGYVRNNPLKYIDPDGEKFKGTDGDEVIIEREKVNGKKIWVIKSGNASEDLKKLVGLINNSGSRTANNMFGKLNKHETMINLVIDSTTSRSQEEINTGSTTIGLHQPHDKNGPLTFNDTTNRFDGKADPAVDDKGNIIKGAYNEATITLFEKKMEELGYSGERLDGKLVSVFGHEARHDLDPIQVQAGLTGTGSDAIWHPTKQGNPGRPPVPKKESPNYFGNKIVRQIERSKGIKIN